MDWAWCWFRLVIEYSADYTVHHVTVVLYLLDEAEVTCLCFSARVHTFMFKFARE